jgi:hypothetical protein
MKPALAEPVAALVEQYLLRLVADKEQERGFHQGPKAIVPSIERPDIRLQLFLHVHNDLFLANARWTI